MCLGKVGLVDGLLFFFKWFFNDDDNGGFLMDDVEFCGFYKRFVVVLFSSICLVFSLVRGVGMFRVFD